MPNHFGVDSASDSRQLFDSVAYTWGNPAFWGRYLANYVLDAAERDAIHARGCAILPIFNGADATTAAGDAAQGAAHGIDAVQRAKALGIPAGTFIPVDIESSFVLSATYLQHYAEALHMNGYVGGPYCNPSVPSHSQAYQLTRQRSTAPMLYYSSEWEPTALNGYRHEDFTPLTIAGYEGECAVWQYAESDLHGTVDLDVVSDQHWAALWHPATPVPPVPPPVVRPKVLDGETVIACALKPDASHTSAAIAQLPADGDIAILPWQVKDKATGEIWQRVRWRDQEGFVLNSNVRSLAPVPTP